VVVDLSNIPECRTKTGYGRNGNTLKQVFRVTAKVFNGTAQAVVEQPEFQGQIVGIACFPGEVGIGNVRNSASGFRHIFI